MYTLENIADKFPAGCLKLTPRSNEAFLKLGYTVDMIAPKTAEEVNSLYDDNISDQRIINKRANHYEQKRQIYLSQLLRKRSQIISNEQNQQLETRMQKSDVAQKSYQQSHCTMVDREYVRLAKMKRKQIKQIGQTVSYSIQMKAIEDQNHQRLMVEKWKEEQRKESVAKKKKEERERRTIRQAMLSKRQKQQSEKNQRILEEMRSRERRKEQIERRKYEEMQAKKRDERLKSKERQQMLQREKEQREKALQELMELKNKAIEENEKQRLQLVAEASRERKEKSEAQRLKREQRLKLAQEANERNLQSLIQKYSEEEQALKARASQFSAHKREIMEAERKLAEEKARKIQGILDRNQQIEQQRRECLIRRQREAAERTLDLEQQRARSLEQKKERQKHREEQRNSVRQNNEQRVKQIQEEVMARITQKEQVILQRKKEQHEECLSRYNEHAMRQKDRQEKALTHLRKLDNERELLKSKLDSKMERVERMSDHKNQLLKQRGLIKKEVNLQKYELSRKLQSLKLGKIHASDLIGSLDVTNLSQSSSSRHEPFNRHKSGNSSFAGKAPNYSRQNSFAGKAPNYSRQNQFDARTHYQNSNRSVLRNIENDHTCRLERSETVTKQDIEALEEIHKAQMLSLLVEEQQKDNQRQQLLSKASGSKKLRMQRQFEALRSKASTKITLLGESQKAKRQLMASQLRS